MRPGANLQNPSKRPATAWTVAIHAKGRGNDFLLGWWCFFFVNALFVLHLAHGGPQPEPCPKCTVF